MASSVSSECAFLSAGITISKYRNQLKSNIVEALQCLKCIFHNDLIFCEIITSEEEEQELEAALLLDSAQEIEFLLAEAEEFSWDQLVEDDEDNKDVIVIN